MPCDAILVLFGILVYFFEWYFSAVIFWFQKSFQGAAAAKLGGGKLAAPFVKAASAGLFAGPAGAVAGGVAGANRRGYNLEKSGNMWSWWEPRDVSMIHDIWLNVLLDDIQ